MGAPKNPIARVALGVSTGGLSELGFQASNALSPKAPNVPRLPAPVTDALQAPERTSVRVRQAAINAAQSAAGAGGYGSTIATSPTGLLKPATTTKKTLLGQ